MENLDVKTDGAAPSASPRDVLTAETKQAWNSGKEIEQPKTEAPASSDAPKQTAESEGKPESSPAAEPGKEPTQEKGSRRKPSAEERIAELTAERNEWRRKAEASQAKPAETKTDAATVKPVEAAQTTQELKEPKEPELKDFEKWEDYDAAYRKYNRDFADYTAKKAVLDFQRQQQLESARQKMTEKISDGKKRYSDFDDVVVPAFRAVVDDPQIPMELKVMLDKSPVPVDLLYAIGSKPEDLQDFVQTAKRDPIAAIRKLVIVEQLVIQELNKAKSEEKPAEKEPEKKPAEPVTRAPKPVSEVGGRGTATEDSGIAAARSGDFRTAKAEWNREFLAANK